MRTFTPLPESPEIGVDYEVYLSLHCGYSNGTFFTIGMRHWQFATDEPSDSVYVEGVLRLSSADSATLTVDGVAHPLIPVADEYGPRCL